MLANPNERRREQARRMSNREKALEALERAGTHGITNIDLMAIAGSRAGGRVDELRQQGHRITCEQVERGLYRYTLRPRTSGRLADLVPVNAERIQLVESAPSFTEGRLFT